MGPVLVVGASGNVVGSAVRALAGRGLQVRAAATSPGRLQLGVPVVRLDLSDPSTFAAAVAGADGLFLMRPPAIARVAGTLNAFLDVAERHGVRHVVFSSVAGADTNRVVPHHRVETHLQASSMGWTILRPGFFAQNLADAYRVDVVGDRRLLLPAGEGRVAFVDTRDVGDVVGLVLADPEAHRGAGYTLTGSRAIGFAEVAAMLGGELGDPVTYQPVSPWTYATHVHARGLPWAQALVQTVLHTGLRYGQAERVDPTLADLLGRPPRTLEAYIHEHRRTWSTDTAVRPA